MEQRPRKRRARRGACVASALCRAHRRVVCRGETAEQSYVACTPFAAGRQQLDRIREQFEEQDADNRRKLDRLNGCDRAPERCPPCTAAHPHGRARMVAHAHRELGNGLPLPLRFRRIAELGENKHAMWSMLRQHQPQKPKAEAEPISSAAPVKASSGSGSARDSEMDEAAKLHPLDAACQLRERESALRAAEAALAQEGRAQTEALALREAALALKESNVEKVCGRMRVTLNHVHVLPCPLPSLPPKTHPRTAFSPHRRSILPKSTPGLPLRGRR